MQAESKPTQEEPKVITGEAKSSSSPSDYSNSDIGADMQMIPIFDPQEIFTQQSYLRLSEIINEAEEEKDQLQVLQLLKLKAVSILDRIQEYEKQMVIVNTLESLLVRKKKSLKKIDQKIYAAQSEKIKVENGINRFEKLLKKNQSKTTQPMISITKAVMNEKIALEKLLEQKNDNRDMIQKLIEQKVKQLEQVQTVLKASQEISNQFKEDIILLKSEYKKKLKVQALAKSQKQRIIKTIEQLQQTQDNDCRNFRNLALKQTAELKDVLKKVYERLKECTGKCNIRYISHQHTQRKETYDDVMMRIQRKVYAVFKKPSNEDEID